jgi:hypothetical protein
LKKTRFFVRDSVSYHVWSKNRLQLFATFASSFGIILKNGLTKSEGMSAWLPTATVKKRKTQLQLFATFCVIIVHHFIFVQNDQKMRFCTFFKKVMLTNFSISFRFLEHLRMNQRFCLYIRLGNSKMDIFKNVQKWILFHQFYAQKGKMMCRRAYFYFLLFLENKCNPLW